MPSQDSDQTVLWIELRTVDNKTSHLLYGDKWELNYSAQTQNFDLINCR